MDLMHSECVRNGCDIVAVCHIRDEECCAFVRRKSARKKMHIEGVAIKNKYVIKNVGAHHYSSMIVKAIKSMLTASQGYTVNFDILPPAETTGESLYKQWESLTVEECQWDILSSLEKVRKKLRTTTERDVTIAKVVIISPKTFPRGIHWVHQSEFKKFIG